MNILVTGANGQLGQCLKSIVDNKGNGEPCHYVHDKNYWIFTGHSELDITDKEAVDKYFQDNCINVVVNCAAYTAVGKAESDRESAHKINATGAENLAKACFKHGAVLIHISTDYVFDGYSNVPFTPDDKNNLKPLNVYGKTKLEGEIAIQESMCKYLIFRTSWLYSIYGENFVKTMLKKITDYETVRVVTDQIGSPTCAQDLADFIYHVVEDNNADNRYLFQTGVYHFANKGVASWYDLACVIREELGGDKYKDIESCLTGDFHASPVERPSYSVLNTRLTEETFDWDIPNWMKSAKKTVAKLTI